MRHNHLNRQQQWDYEEIDRLSSDAKQHAESTCHKLTVGRVQWCPQLTKAIARILYWKGIRKCHTGGHIGMQHLHCLAKKGGTLHSLEHLQLAITTIETHICQAYKQYAKLKKDTGRRDTWLKQLIAAQAQEQQTMTKAIWKKLHTTEKICNNAQMIKSALARLTTWRGLTHVIGPHPVDPNLCIKSKTKAELEAMCLLEAG